MVGAGVPQGLLIFCKRTLAHRRGECARMLWDYVLAYFVVRASVSFDTKYM
jgi:hypothetical protein